MGIRDFNPLPESVTFNALAQAELDRRKKQFEVESLPEKNRLANEKSALENKWYEPNVQSEIGQRNAISNKYNTMTPLEAQKLQIENKYLPEMQQADIGNKLAQSEYYKMGGGRGSAGTRDEFIYQSQVAKDNPNLQSPEQIRQAANAYSRGETQLPDGTKLNAPGEDTLRLLGRVNKGATTSALYTNNVQANQAHAELEVLDNYAQKALAPYGDTVFNMSPQQIMDSFKKDDESQIKLGRLIASQALQYEASQNRIKLANGKPGVTATEELMKLSGQQISTHFPKLSYVARKEATRYLDEALNEGLKARNKVGLGVNTSNSRSKEPKNKTWVFNQETGRLEAK